MVQNEHTRHLAYPPEYGIDLNARHAEQVARASNSILTEMCIDLGVKDDDSNKPHAISTTQQ